LIGAEIEVRMIEHDTSEEWREYREDFPAPYGLIHISARGSKNTANFLMCGFDQS
jgi:hypothetical protein